MNEPNKFILHSGGTSRFREVPLALTGLPKEDNGAPVHYLRKEIIPIGVSRRHPDAGYEVNVPAERAARWVSAFKMMLERGHAVPAPPDHKDRSNSYGRWIDFSIEQNERGGTSLFGDIRVVGDQNRDAVLNKDVSICTVRNFPDDRGHVYDEAIEHVAVTPYSALTGLSGWTSIAASRGQQATERVPVFEMTANLQEPDMADLSALRTAIGAAASVSDADVISQATSKLGTITTLTGERDTARTELATAKQELSRAKPAEGEFPAAIATGSFNNLSREIELMAREGKISGEQATAAKAMIGTPEKPNTLQLSRTGADHPAEGWLKVLSLGKSDVKPDGKQMTVLQTLDRQSHDHSKSLDLSRSGENDAQPDRQAELLKEQLKGYGLDTK